MKQDNTIHDILAQREDFLVIGLTGRMGSGCSRVAEVLATPFERLQFPCPEPQPGLRSLTDEERAIRIIAEYAEAHWLKFEVIQVGAVIATFILDDDDRFVADLSRGKAEEENKHQRAFRGELLEKCYRETINICLKYQLLDDVKNIRNKKRCAKSQDKEKAKSQGYVEIGPDTYARLSEDDIQKSLERELNDLGLKLMNMVSADKNIQNYADKNIQNYFNVNCDDSFQRTLFLSPSKNAWENVGKKMSYLYRQVLQKYPNIHRRKYLEYVDQLVEIFSILYLVRMLDELHKGGDNAAEDLWKRLQKINRSIEPNVESDDEVIQIEKFVFVHHITTWFGRVVRKYVTEVLGEDAYSRLFQRYGQMVRYFSCIPGYDNAPQKGTTPEESETNPGRKKDIFAIPRKINQHIKVLRHPFLSKDHRPVRIVVDSVKNVFEAIYLRYRYSAFYLWAITTDPVIREHRLRAKHLTDIQVRKMDWNEYPDKGGEVIAEVKNILKEQKEKDKNSQVKKDPNSELEAMCRDILKKNLADEAKVDFYLDRLNNLQVDSEEQKEYLKKYEEFNTIRREFFTNNTYVFYTQDVNSCVCNADVYLFNNGMGDTDTENRRKLLEAVVRNVSLVMYPCLVRPTPIERCMQIALSAKVNSGCLSRQVGAVITDSQYNILAIGWNDVPCGEVPCAYKNVLDISNGADIEAYSEYELHDPDFRKRISRYKAPASGLQGLPFSYCFKTVHKDTRDPMRSRAMHAEEKALALCGKEAEGGYLFTTSSPCEMCSKNAKNHKIRKIYYLEAYPGISQAQYTNSGTESNRAELILFSGAVGRAYMQMYTPLLPHKDVLGHLGVKKEE